MEDEDKFNLDPEGNFVLDILHFGNSAGLSLLYKAPITNPQ
jgi:hypothetical protein